jgi:hypothetical protein
MDITGRPLSPACLATSLNNLPIRPGDLGRQEETLAAIHEASTIRWYTL